MWREKEKGLYVATALFKVIFMVLLESYCYPFRQ